MEGYMKKQLGDLPPHIYAIANEVYDSMWRQREKQCVLIRLDQLIHMQLCTVFP